MFRIGALAVGLAMLAFQPAMAQAPNGMPSIDIGPGTPAPAQGTELNWIMSAPSKDLADELVAHFSADGYACESVQQGRIWTIMARKPFTDKNKVDAIRVQAEAYVTAKGGTFNGGGLGTPGAIQIHRDPPQSAAHGAATAWEPGSQIAAGAVAARKCFDPSITQIMDMLRCVVPMITLDDTNPDRSKAEFAIGANFVSSFMFDAMYNDFKQNRRDPELIEDMRKIAVANYKAWDQLSRAQHLSDEDIGTGMAADPGRVATCIALVKQLRTDLEALKGTSL